MSTGATVGSLGQIGRSGPPTVEKFQAKLKAMARKRIVLAAKLPSARLKKRTRHANRYSVLDYIEVLGDPVEVTACGYLALMKWTVEDQ